MAFSSRRKKLINNLKGLIQGTDDMMRMQELLEVRGLKPAARAEELSVDDFVALTKTFVASGYKLDDAGKK